MNPWLCSPDVRRTLCNILHCSFRRRIDQSLAMKNLAKSSKRETGQQLPDEQSVNGLTYVKQFSRMGLQGLALTIRDRCRKIDGGSCMTGEIYLWQDLNESLTLMLDIPSKVWSVSLCNKEFCFKFNSWHNVVITVVERTVNRNFDFTEISPNSKQIL